VKGVIHRDLKPSNILVDNESGRAKISDFGIAAIEATGSELSTLTRENISLGTINYMSPEQRLNAHTVTLHTDIFSFGVMFYEMLTGKLPIGHFKLPSFVNHQVPIGFDDVVKKCLAQSPADRYQSAGEIKGDLGRITGRHLKLQSKSPPPPLRGWRSPARRYAIAGGAAVLAIALAVVLLPRAHRGRTESVPAPVALEYQRALALIGQNKSSEAIPLLTDIRARGSRPQAANAEFAICQVYRDSGDYKTALKEYDAFVRSYAESPKVPEALMDKCAIRRKTMRTSGMLSTKYYSGDQQQLVKDLKKLIDDYPQSEQVPKAWALIAEVCDKPELNDWKMEAEALFALYECEPVSGRDSLLKAADLYAGKVNDKALADKAYERFIHDFPDDPRRAEAEKARKSLNISK